MSLAQKLKKELGKFYSFFKSGLHNKLPKKTKQNRTISSNFSL